MPSNVIKWICLALIGLALCLLVIFYILGFWNFQPDRNASQLPSIPDIPVSTSPVAPIVYSFGLEPLSDGEYQSIPQAVIPENIKGALPATWSLAHKMPRAGMQGHQGSCTAWAVAYALKSYQEEVERNWGLDTPVHLFSPSYIYNQFSRGRDRGMPANKALDLLATKGCATMATMPYNPNDCSRKPSSQANEEAKNYRITFWGRVDSDINVIKQFLTSGCPLIIGIPAGDNLYQENLIKSNYIYKSLGKGNGNGHAVVLVGYDDKKSAFQFLNSWGTDWGENGYAWIDYDFFSQVCRQIFYAQDSSMSERGSIRITSAPSGANVYLNGSYKGTAPLILANLSSVNYTIEVSQPGYKPYNASVQLTSGKNSNLYAVLQLAAPPNPPSNLMANSIGLHQIDLAWSDNSDNEDGFIIEQRTDKTDYRQIDRVFMNVTTRLVNNLSVPVTYYYRIMAYNKLGYSAYSNEVAVSTIDISKRIIVVRNDMCNANKRFDGNYDRIEDVLKRRPFPHTVVGKAEFDKDSYLLDDKIIVIFDCNRYWNHCCNPNHTLILREDGKALKCQGQGDCLEHNTRLSDKTIEKIRQFVGSGGCLFTEDLQIDEIISRTFTGLITYTGVYVKNEQKWEEQKIKVLPAITDTPHALLEGLFDTAQLEAADITMKIHNYTSDIKILDKDAVTALLISPDVSGDDNDDGIAAVTFKYYASPEKYGRVVHLMGHLTGQDSRRSELALLKLFANLLRDYNARGGK